MKDTRAAARWHLFASPVFIAAVGILLLNDFVLKAAFHNALTGKLSDFAGLFAATLFACAIRPENGRHLVLGIGIAFIWWKSPASQQVIDAASTMLPVRIGRVVDYTDLIALPMIPLAWRLAPRLRPWTPHAWLRVSMAGISAFAFSATSSFNHDTVKQSLQFGPAGPVPQSELAAAIDAVAARHGLKCAVCDPITLGRMYTVDGVLHQRSLYLAVSLDIERNHLDYEAGTLTFGDKRASGDFGALSNSLIEGVREIAPAITLAPMPDPGRGQRIELTVAKRQTSSSSRGAVEQYERQRAEALVAEVAQKYEFRPGGPGAFRRGRLLGTQWELTIDIQQKELIAVSLGARGEKGNPAAAADRRRTGDAPESRVWARANETIGAVSCRELPSHGIFRVSSGVAGFLQLQHCSGQ